MFYWGGSCHPLPPLRPTTDSQRELSLPGQRRIRGWALPLCRHSWLSCSCWRRKRSHNWSWFWEFFTEKNWREMCPPPHAHVAVHKYTDVCTYRRADPHVVTAVDRLCASSHLPWILCCDKLREKAVRCEDPQLRTCSLVKPKTVRISFTLWLASSSSVLLLSLLAAPCLKWNTCIGKCCTPNPLVKDWRGQT